MEIDNDTSTTQAIIRWNRLYERAPFNENYKQAFENKKKVQRFDNFSSPVYRRQRQPPGPVKAQNKHFRLAPFLAEEELLLQTNHGSKIVTVISDAGTSLCVDDGRIQLPSFPKKLSTRQLWIIFAGRTKLLTRTSPEYPESPDSAELQSRDLHSEMSMWTSSEMSTPLPVFLRRPPTEMFLYRRPTIGVANALPVGDEFFVELSKTIDLKALPFKKTADSFKFYETHFPLLLTRISLEGERCTTPSKRSRTPESPMSVMIQRQRQLHQRLVDLECMMDAMAKETEDCKFVTELYDPIFDPTKWTWNKLDVVGLRRRYTIDASLREM